MIPQTPEALEAAFRPLNVLVIGDVMVDSYLWGRVDRISPEAPVPVLQVQNREKRLGGAANVALNVQALGATPFLCAVVGEDPDAEALRFLLEENRMPEEGLVLSPDRVTTIKHRIISGSQHMLRVDAETTEPLSLPEEELVVARIEKLLPRMDLVIFEDYDKGTITQGVIEKTVAAARAAGVPVAVDPKKRNFLHYKGATLFKPNLKELRQGLKIDLDPADNQQLSRAVDLLRERLAAENALVTLSERGMFLSNASNHYHVPAHRRSITDVSGAGDTVISIAAMGMALGLPPRLWLELANLGGGLVCESVGVVPLDRQRFFQEVARLKLMAHAAG